MIEGRIVLGDDFTSTIWPPLPNGDIPVWKGSYFEVAGQSTNVIAYEVGESGWDDELADRVYGDASRRRPIGVASRANVIMQFKNWLSEKKAPVILDVGCGSSFMLEDIQRVFPKALLIGSDYVAPALENLAVETPGIPLVQMDITRKVFPDEIFDGISILNVLEHVEDDRTAMKNLFRMLKPGGIAVIEVPAGPRLFDAFDKQMKHFRRYAMGELVEKLSAVGFEVVSRSHLGFIVYPAFLVGKLLNKQKLKASESEQKKSQQKILDSTKSGRLLDWAFRIEGYLRRVCYLPIGIRCVVTCRKSGLP